MFDISFTELMVIAVVALVVIGPERLPKVARTMGLLLGRFNRYVGNVKADIEREMRMDELKKFQQQVEDGARGAQQMIVEETQKAEQSVKSVTDSLNAAGEQVLSTEPVAEPPADPIPESQQLNLGLDQPPVPPAKNN